MVQKYSSNFTGLDEKSKTERTKFNVAVGFGQPLPGNSHRFFIGFSYFSGRIDEEMNTSTTSWVCPVDEVKPYSLSTYTYCPTQRVAQTTEGASNTLNVKETGMGLGISYNFLSFNFPVNSSISFIKFWPNLLTSELAKVKAILLFFI